ncbi:MAG: L-rhamnose isomerase [Kiritimatiellia bacterium]
MRAFESPLGESVAAAYKIAKERYAALGVDTDVAIERALQLPVSLHCWQGDDVQGFEVKESTSGGGIMATGNFPGRARNGDELRQDLDAVLKLLPGSHRLNLHAFYAETNGKVVDRDALEPAHFSRWMDWAKDSGIALDFNPTFFAHPKADDGFTLSNADDGIRAFWVRHGIACRKIAVEMGKRQGGPCVINHWIPDGSKDLPADRWGPRQRLVESLDGMLAKDTGVDTDLCVDAVESKLFGIGSEAYVVGSAEFYQAYALQKGILYCLDMGHFHPTETIHDKLSSLLQFHKRVLMHVSRPIRWDSDHVVIWNDDLSAVFQELVRGHALDRVFVALDFFDASINRVGAYVTGARATRKALLSALLEPVALLQALEREGRGAEKLGLMEDLKVMPFGAVWDMLCEQAGVPAGAGWIAQMQAYADTVQALRA